MISAINRNEIRIMRARRKGGRFCGCCCAVGLDKGKEARQVARARRRLDKAIVAYDFEQGGSHGDGQGV